jgi:Fic family protein
MSTWIWQHADWPHFCWQEDQIIPLLRNVRLQQGILLGKTGNINYKSSQETALDSLLQNIITSSAIEGEVLNVQSVRSSLAKRLGLKHKHSSTTARSEGLAQILMDAICNLEESLTLERLYQWHRWLFPNIETSIYKIMVGELRGDEEMQVVSGRIDKPIVHFEAPPRNILERELVGFIDWFNNSRNENFLDPLLRAGICHFWFVTLHPFDDGNGRITRALTDLALAQENQQSIRLYAMSATILENRQDYYRVLENSQRGDLDITAWLVWFLNILNTSLNAAIGKIDLTLAKSLFWQQHQVQVFLPEQVKILNRLFDDERLAQEGVSAAKYQKITKVSKATATRHLTDLLAKGCLEKQHGAGRSTRYKIKLHLSELSNKSPKPVT